MLEPPLPLPMLIVPAGIAGPDDIEAWVSKLVMLSVPTFEGSDAMKPK